MTSSETIHYFNDVSTYIFDCLSEIKYSVRLIEINEEKGFIGFSIDTDYYCSQITVLMPDKCNYKEDTACSVQMYGYNDDALEVVLFTEIQKSIEECMGLIITEEVYHNIAAPKFHMN